MIFTSTDLVVFLRVTTTNDTNTCFSDTNMEEAGVCPPNNVINNYTVIFFTVFICSGEPLFLTSRISLMIDTAISLG
ncbi:hypothetical protein LA52FAK_29830 [Desulforhopalus sp. 52FAK]